MQPNGFIKIHRKLREWKYYDVPNMVAVWLELLLRASYEGTTYRGVELKKGQVVFGRKELAETLGLSEQNIRTCINKLISANQITIETTNRFTVATIVKWEEYQFCNDNDNQQNNQISNQQVTSNQPTTNQQLTTIKKEKKDKKDKNNTFIGACAQDDVWSIPLLSLFEEEFGRTISSNEAMLISQIENDYDDLLIRYALREAMTRGKKSVQYIDRILVDWKQRDFTTKDYEEGKR